MSAASPVRSRPAASQAAPPAPGGASRGLGWGCSAGAILLGLGTIVLCSGGFYVLGHLVHNGQEFSPQTFERRTYEYGELHPFGRQLWGITRTPIGRTSFETYLVGQKMIPLKKRPERWDVIWSVERMPASHRDAAILTRALDEIGPDGGFVWHRWSADHPEMAKALWPCVATLAEDYLYVYVPEILDLALDADGAARDAETFEKELLARMQAIYSDLAEDERASGNVAVADRLAERAALFGKPDWREILFEGAVEPSETDVKASAKEPEIVEPPGGEDDDAEKRDETQPVEDEDEKSTNDEPKEQDQENEETSDAETDDAPESP